MTDEIPQTRIDRIIRNLDPLDSACLVAMAHTTKTVSATSNTTVRLSNLGCIKRQFKSAPNAGDWILTELGEAVAAAIEDRVNA